LPAKSCIKLDRHTNISKLSSPPGPKLHQAGQNEESLYIHHYCNHAGNVAQPLSPFPRFIWQRFLHPYPGDDTFVLWHGFNQE
jgi:hypothetical protein